jgi:hypothetical protein
MTAPPADEGVGLLKCARDATRLTWAQLAFVLDVRPGTIRKWRFRTKRVPSGPAKQLLEVLAAGAADWPPHVHDRVSKSKAAVPIAGKNGSTSTRSPSPMRLASNVEHGLGICSPSVPRGIISCLMCGPPPSDPLK